MSKVSSKQRYEAFQEWLNWGKSQYPSLRKKKKTPMPEWMQDLTRGE